MWWYWCLQEDGVVDPVVGLGALFGLCLAARPEMLRCLVLRAFRKLAVVGSSLCAALGAIKHDVFPGKPNAILQSPSHVITGVIIAIIFDASVPNVKVVRVFLLRLQSGLFRCFFPFCALSAIEQLPEVWWGHRTQKVIPVFFCQWVWGACEWPLSRLLISEAGANVRSDLCEERGGCANIILALWVNFCTLSCISLH